MHSTFRAGILIVALATAMAGAPGAAAAQVLVVRVTDAATGQPLQGAMVAVTSSATGRSRSTLSDGAGRARLLELEAGTYAVRAELIGFATTTRAGVVVAPDAQVMVDLRLNSRAIELEGLSVRGEERCRVRPDEGLQVARVWDEVRKALEATRLTSESGAYRYRTRDYLRDVEESGVVVNQESRRSTTIATTPYRSRPAEDLIRNGFVQAANDEQGGQFYYAPDAGVLLSDPFLDSHCLRLRLGERENAGLVGLAFEPVAGRDLPDIAGTLWLEATSLHLVRLEFRYVNVLPHVELRNVGGDVSFQRLPDGTWIVPDWNIRTPWLAQRSDFRGQPRLSQHGVRIEGGTVLSVSEPGGATILSASTATIEGVVLHEITSEPVTGAEVTLAGTDERATTGPDGHFRFASLVPGPYQVVFAHESMAPFGMPVDPVAVDAVQGQVSSVRLHLPTPITLADRICAADIDTRPPRTSVVVGRVLATGSELPLDGAEVTIRWDEFSVGTPDAGWVTASRRERGVPVTAREDGSFRACVVPDETLLRFQARWGGFEATTDTLRIPADEPVGVIDLFIPVGSDDGDAGVGHVEADNAWGRATHILRTQMPRLSTVIAPGERSRWERLPGH